MDRMSGEEIEVGDAVEFMSDIQTEKGPSAGTVASRIDDEVYICHSDTCEWFDRRRLDVERKTTRSDGRTLWILE